MHDVRRASTRFTTVDAGITTHHSFSFGGHYDPDNVGFGALVAHNDERLDAGAGYDEHRHTDVEILTWVLDGAVLHRDSSGNAGVVRPGLVQLLAAGRGVRHSERSDGDGPTRFVQMWLRPDRTGLDPSYALADVTGVLAAGALVPVASGDPKVPAPVALRTGGAVLRAARMSAGGHVQVPQAAHLHLFVARGTVRVDGVGELGEADALRLTGEPGARVTAPYGAEVLVLTML